jgi:phosphate-selective porin OprO/OprP
MWTRSADRAARAAVRPSPGLRRRTVLGLVSGCLWLAATTTPAADLFVIAESEDGQAIALPSAAREFASFADVAQAVQEDRARVTALEVRLQQLEQRAATPPELLPKPEARATPDSAGSTKSEAPEDEKKPAEPYEIGSDTAFKTKWASGFHAESANKDFRLKVGGRTQIDASAFTAGPGPNQAAGQAGLNPELADTVNFRRGRLRVEGRMYEFYDFAAEYDFINEINVNNVVFPNERDAGPITAVTDLWLQIRELPVLGVVRVGNQKDPYGFEHLTSSRWLNFMERSFSQDAFEGPFNNGFLPGIQVMNNAYDGRLAWQIGEFKNTNNPFGFSNTSGGSMTVGRLVYLPIFEDEGRKLLHLGLSGRTMEPQRRAPAYDPVTGVPQGPTLPYVRFRSRGDIRNGPPGPLNSIYADTGLIQANWQNMIGLEFVGNNGPWSFQSEYFGSWLYNARLPSLATDGFTNNKGASGQQPAPGTNLGTVYYQGGYAEVLYFLTGDSRTYSLIESRFDRPVPLNNFYAIRGGGSGRRLSLSEGAWQVGVRYNYLCLDDGQVNGGVLNGMTLGLNWLLNPNARVYFNYDFTYRQFVNADNVNGSGCINGFGTRLAFDF